MDPLLSIYLRGGWAPAGSGALAPGTGDLRAHLQAAALALVTDGERGLAQVGEQGFLVNRVGWFIRFLDLLPEATRDHWVGGQVRVMERQAIAALEAHERLLPMLFDPQLGAEERMQAQALWLAIVATGTVWLDDKRRSGELAEARQLLSLAHGRAAPGTVSPAPGP